jgi:hypothetical protein
MFCICKEKLRYSVTELPSERFLKPKLLQIIGSHLPNFGSLEGCKLSIISVGINGNSGVEKVKQGVGREIFLIRYSCFFSFLGLASTTTLYSMKKKFIYKTNVA